jgi:glycogen(starch) synthase
VNFLHIIHRYYPYVGGSELYFQEIGERLAREGHGVSVYTTDAWDLEHFWAGGKRRVDRREEIHNGVHIKRFPVDRLPAAPLAYPLLRRAMVALAQLPLNVAPLLFGLSRWAPRIPALERALDSLDKAGQHFDLVHAANISLDSIVYAAYRFAIRRDIPLIITPFTHLGEAGNLRILRQCTMPHQMEMLRRAEAVITQTELETEALTRHGVSREKMHVVGVGVNPGEVLGGEGARFRAKYRIEGPIVFFVGAAAYDKGTMHLVEAMEKLWRRNEQSQLPTLVIAGPQLSQFAKFLAGRPPETRRRTHVLGFIPDADKRDLYAAGDVFVLPSRTDSFGIVYLEAWLYNKPVIGARAGGVPEVIADGRDGFLVTFGDTDALAARIEQLLTDRALAQCFGEAGHTKVIRALTWDEKYPQLRAIYEKLAAK